MKNKNEVKKSNYSIENKIVAFAKKVTELSANTTCAYIAHQPKLPDSAKKLRKF